MAFSLAFSIAGVILYGAGAWGFGGYRWGVLLNQLIGCVLLKYLLAKIIGLCSPIMLVTSSSATQSLWSVYFVWSKHIAVVLNFCHGFTKLSRKISHARSQDQRSLPSHTRCRSSMSASLTACFKSSFMQPVTPSSTTSVGPCTG